MLAKNCYLGQLPRNIMNGHPLIQAHTSDTYTAPEHEQS